MTEPSPPEDSINKISAEDQTRNQELLQEIHNAIAELDAQTRQQRELTDEMYYSRLPLVLFHATTSQKAKRIMLEGLLPQRLIYEDTEVVSLSDTIGFAKFCASTTQGVAPSDLAVLEITTQGLDRELAQSFLTLLNPVKPNELLHEVHYHAPISADFIYKLSAEEAAEIEKTE